MRAKTMALEARIAGPSDLPCSTEQCPAGREWEVDKARRET